MSESLEAIKDLIDGCTADERRLVYEHVRKRVLPHPLEAAWGIDADTILNAIRRASDLTKRGVRGIIAEAVFERDVLPLLPDTGWHPIIAPPGDLPYDSLLERDGKTARIQVKLQRLEAGQPKRFWPKKYEQGLYVVEVQKTRTGKRKKNSGRTALTQAGAAVEIEAEETRPYRFGDFDILAVNMHPSTREWGNFRYTVASWLLPRAENSSLIEVFQPVSLQPNLVWSDDLATCLEWFLEGEQRRVLDTINHTVRLRKKGATKKSARLRKRKAG